MKTEMPPKKRVTVSISKEMLDWIDEQVEKRVYKDRSHAIEKLIYDRKVETERTG